MRSKGFVDTSSLQAVCNTPIARITDWVCVLVKDRRKGRRQPLEPQRHQGPNRVLIAVINLCKYIPDEQSHDGMMALVMYMHHFFFFLQEKRNSNDFGLNAFTTGKPFLLTTLLDVSIGRDFGALKGLRKSPIMQKKNSAKKRYPNPIPIHH